MRTLVLCRVVAESRGVVRKRKVVIDGLRAVDVCNRIVLCCKELGNPVCRRSRVVTAHSHEKLDVVLFEKVEVEVFLEIFVGRLETAHLKVGTAAVEVAIGLGKVDVLGAGVL